MFRRLLRAFHHPSPVEAEAPLPTAPDDRFIDVGGLRQLLDADPLCLDLRPVSALRYGFVQGAWLLPDPVMMPPTERAVIVLAADPEAAVSLGWPVTWGGLAAWRSAGFALREPEWKSPLPLLHPVTVGGEPGWIQDVLWNGAGFDYAVLLRGGRRLDGLREEEVTSLGARGAAGLGEVV